MKRAVSKFPALVITSSVRYVRTLDNINPGFARRLLKKQEAFTEKQNFTQTQVNQTVTPTGPQGSPGNNDIIISNEMISPSINNGILATRDKNSQIF